MTTAVKLRKAKPKQKPKQSQSSKQEFYDSYGIPKIERESLTFYLTPDHKEALIETAREKGMNVSTYLRMLTQKELCRPIKRYKLVEYYE